MNKPRIVVYTVVTDGKDRIPLFDFPGYKLQVFQDDYDKFKDPRRNSRIQKILSHLYFDADFTIYLDGNRQLLVSPEELVARYMDGFDIALFKHGSRDCIYKEAMECARLKLDDPELIIEQAKYYEDHEFAKEKGLYECGVMIRRMSPKMRAFENEWWANYCRFSRRDQLSFMPAMDLAGLVVNGLPNDYLIDENGVMTRGGIVQISSHQNFEGNFNDPKLNENKK